MNETQNLKKEIDVWVTDKKDAIEIIALLWSKFDLSFQDFVEQLREEEGRLKALHSHGIQTTKK